MAEQILKTRIVNKHAELSAWNSSSLVLKEGEIALAKIMVAQPDGTEAPTFIAKIGNNDTFANSPYLFAKASDVYGWAKATTKPGYTATEITRGSSNVAADLVKVEEDITTLKTAIGAGGSVADAIKAAIEALDAPDAEVANQFVTAVAEADGKITVTRRALAAEDIPALEIAKITGLQDALDAKATTSYVDQQDNAIKSTIGSKTDAATVDTVYGAIAAAKAAGDAAQADIDAYQTSNDAALADVRGIAEAARTEAEVNSQIDAKISTFKTGTVDPISERVTANATAISEEVTRAKGVESGLDTRLTAAEAAIGTLNSATTLEGVGTLEQRPATGKAEGAIWIATDNNKEYVWDGSKWVELGDTTVELSEINTLKEKVSAIESDLSEQGDTTKAIAAAKAAADAAQADATEALAAIAVINGSEEGSINKAVADEAAIREAADTAINNKIGGSFDATNTVAKAITAAADAASAAQTAIDTHAGKKDNPHEVTKAQVGLGDVENKSTATIKSEFTGAVANNDEGFVTGGAVYTAVEAVKTAAANDAAAKVKVVADDLDAAETEISTIKNNYARVSGDQLVYGQGENEMVIIFDCGGAE